MAAEAFRLAGWDAHNLSGGIEAWTAAGLAVEGG
jgi:rhodanese-related sulfurtransferase